jgi:hypothetical protein
LLIVERKFQKLLAESTQAMSDVDRAANSRLLELKSSRRLLDYPYVGI